MRDFSSGLRRWAVRATACVALSVAGAGWAAAQEIEPNEFVPAPDGTNLAIGYDIYGHNSGYNVANGPKIKNSGLEVNIGIARFVHFAYIGDMPAGIQVLQAFGSESAGHISTERLGSAFGASNTLLSAFIWPYANVEKHQYLVLAGFVQGPNGTYDKNSPLNLAGAFGSNGWLGDFQIGWDQGIGEHFSYDLGFDVRSYGDTTGPRGVRNSTDTDFRLQAWFNWNWTRAFQTSIGYEGIFGGTGYTQGFQNGTTSQFQRVRGAASLFVAPNTQLLLELNHSFDTVGGFRQVFGATGRIVYIF